MLQHPSYLSYFCRGHILFKILCLVFFCLIWVFLVSRISGAKLHRITSCCVTTCDGADDWGGGAGLKGCERPWVQVAESERCVGIKSTRPFDCIRIRNFRFVTCNSWMWKKELKNIKLMLHHDWENLIQLRVKKNFVASPSRRSGIWRNVRLDIWTTFINKSA